MTPDRRAFLFGILSVPVAAAIPAPARGAEAYMGIDGALIDPWRQLTPEEIYTDIRNAITHLMSQSPGPVH